MSPCFADFGNKVGSWQLQLVDSGKKVGELAASADSRNKVLRHSSFSWFRRWGVQML